MSNETKVNPGNFSVVGLLGVAFVVLKLCGVINWSWWWVTAPFWIPSAIALVIVAVLLGLVGLSWLVSKKGTPCGR